MGDKPMGSFKADQGGVYSLLVAKNPETAIDRTHSFVLTEPNSIHILWLIPQYFVITASEIMISVTGLEFSYSQAPDSMKSVVQAAWLLTVAFGNIIVIIVASAKALGQASEFFMFAVLMILDMFFLMFLAYRYTPYNRWGVVKVFLNSNLTEYLSGTAALQLPNSQGWRWRRTGWPTTTSRATQTCDF